MHRAGVGGTSLGRERILHSDIAEQTKSCGDASGALAALLHGLGCAALCACARVHLVSLRCFFRL